MNKIEETTLTVLSKNSVDELKWSDYLFTWSLLQEVLGEDHQVFCEIDDDAKPHQKFHRILEIAQIMRPLDQDSSEWS